MMSGRQTCGTRYGSSTIASAADGNEADDTRLQAPQAAHQSLESPAQPSAAAIWLA